MSTGDKLNEAKAILSALLEADAFKSLVDVGRAQGIAWAGLYFAQHSGSTKYHAFFQNAFDRLATKRLEFMPR